jgi:hypothetical protein
MTARQDEPRLFTVEMANRALPLVRRIVDDIVAEHGVWKDLVARHELAAAGARPERGETPEQLELQRAANRSAERIAVFVGELEQVGVQLKGFEQGLVDFYGLHEGRLVYLCWQRGEERVTHWHELEAGFAGRRPITPDFEAAEVG